MRDVSHSEMFTWNDSLSSALTGRETTTTLRMSLVPVASKEMKASDPRKAN